MNWKGRKMFSSAVNMVGGGSVPYPSYQQGDLVMPAPLFEEGDQDINMALNTMASTPSPSVSDVKETVSMDMGAMGAMGAMGEMPKDQGPMNFEQDLMELKKEYKNEIFSFISKPGAVEKLQPFLKTMQLSYQNDLTDMMKRHGVKEYSPEQELFTPEFMEEVKKAFDSGGIQEMQDGDIVLPTTQEQLDSVFSAFPGKFDIAEFNTLPETTRQMLVTRALIEKGTKAPVSAGQSPLDVVYKEGVDGADPTTVRQRLNQIIEERKKLARESAVMPQTKQGGILGFASQVNALKANQAAAESQALGDEINLLKSLSTGSRAGLGKDTVMPSDLITEMTIGTDPGENDEAILKLAQTQAKQVEESVPLLGHVYFKQMSPQGFFRMFPHYAGTKEIKGVTYTIDEWIEKVIEDSKVDPNDPVATDLVVAGALGSWVYGKAADPLGIN